jgi:hypothetical protein
MTLTGSRKDSLDVEPAQLARLIPTQDNTNTENIADINPTMNGIRTQ